MARSRYQAIEVTDMKTGHKSFKIYERPARHTPHLFGGLTREEAEKKLRELNGVQIEAIARQNA